MPLPKVLIVNDDVHSAVAIKSMLLDASERDAYEIVLAYSGEEALRHILKEDFSVVLLDVKMPTMDGFETADAIHSHPRLTSLPIIFITAHYDEELYRLYGYQKGAVDYVFMPVNPKILQTKVSVFVQMARQALALQVQNHQLHAINDHLRVRRVLDTPESASATGTDGSQKREPDAQDLNDSSGRDALTGLLNQQLITEHLAHAVNYAARHQEHFALIVLELDGLKAVNERDGQEAGNALLQQTAECIMDAVRVSDLVGRFRGNEFMVLLKGIAGAHEAQQVSDKLAKSINAMCGKNEHRSGVTAKIGLAVFPQNGESPREVMNAAYRAMAAQETVRV